MTGGTFYDKEGTRWIQVAVQDEDLGLIGKALVEKVIDDLKVKFIEEFGKEILESISPGVIKVIYVGVKKQLKSI